MQTEPSKLSIKPIGKKDLVIIWNLIYTVKNPDWKKWDAPYFPLKHLTLDEFKSNYKTDNKMSICLDKKIIGTVSYYWEDMNSHWLEIGITIYSAHYWSNGYGKKALTLWINHLFGTLPLVRVGLTTWSANKAMIKLAQNLGMQQEACLRKCRLWQGKYYDSIRFGVLKEEWFHHLQTTLPQRPDCIKSKPC